MKPVADLIWALCPIVAAINRIAGWGSPSLRRIGIPLAVLLFIWLRFGFRKPEHWVSSSLYAVSAFAAFSLPLTLFGDSVAGNVMNWAWIWMLGLIQALPTRFLCSLHPSWTRPAEIWAVGVLVYCFSYGAIVTASNALGWPAHAWVEITTGLIYGGLAAAIIGERDYND